MRVELSSADREETERLIQTTRRAASELREQAARTDRTIAESREILRLIASSAPTRLSSERSDS